MKSFATLSLFAAVAFAQNEFPDPDFEPLDLPIKEPLDTFVPSTLPIGEELVKVNASTVNLDKAIIAFTDAATVAPALQASADLIDQLDESTARINGIPQVANDDANSIPALIPYVASLVYHVNHTVNNLIAKKELAASFCQGPTVLTAVQDTTARAVAFNQSVYDKINPDFQNLVYVLTDPLFEALDSAGAAFADQTTTQDGCTPVTDGPTTGPTSEPTSTTTTTTSGGAEPTSDVPTYGNPDPTSDVPTYGNPDPTSDVPTYGNPAPTTGKPYPTACKSRYRRRRAAARAEKQL